MHAGSLDRGRGQGSSRAGSSGSATRGHTGAATRPREGLRGGHETQGRRPSAAPRHTAGSNPLTPNPPVAREATTLKAFNPRKKYRSHTHTPNLAYTGSTGRPGKNGTTRTHTHTHTHTHAHTCTHPPPPPPPAPLPPTRQQRNGRLEPMHRMDILSYMAMKPTKCSA